MGGDEAWVVVRRRRRRPVEAAAGGSGDEPTKATLKNQKKKAAKKRSKTTKAASQASTEFETSILRPEEEHLEESPLSETALEPQVKAELKPQVQSGRKAGVKLPTNRPVVTEPVEENKVGWLGRLFGWGSVSQAAGLKDEERDEPDRSSQLSESKPQGVPPKNGQKDEQEGVAAADSARARTKSPTKATSQAKDKTTAKTTDPSPATLQSSATDQIPATVQAAATGHPPAKIQAPATAPQPAVVQSSAAEHSRATAQLREAGPLKIPQGHELSRRPDKLPTKAPPETTAVKLADADWDRGRFWSSVMPGGDEGSGHYEMVTGVALCADVAVSVGWDSMVKLWSWTDQGLTERKTLRGHTDRIEAVVLLSSSRAMTGGKDCTLRSWNLTHGTMLRKMYVYESVKAVESMSDCQVAAGYRSGGVQIWDVEKGQALGSVNRCHEDEIMCLSSRKGNVLLTGSADGLVKVLDLGLGSNPVASLGGNSGRVYSVKPSGEHLVYVGDFSGGVKVYDLRKGGQSDPVSVIANAPGGDVGARAPIAGLAVKEGMLVSTAAGFWEENADDVEGCLQFHAIEKGTEAKYCYTTRSGGGLLTCLAADGDSALAGDINGTLFGIQLVRKGSDASSSLDVLEGFKWEDGCSLLDSDDEDSEDD